MGNSGVLEVQLLEGFLILPLMYAVTRLLTAALMSFMVENYWRFGEMMMARS
jgi:hypothetical protein